MIGFLVLKKIRQRDTLPVRAVDQPAAAARPALVEGGAGDDPASESSEDLDQQLLADAVAIMLDAAANGQTVSQRALAARLRERGHHFSNTQLRAIVTAASADTDHTA